ncbi:MAG: rhodanese-like domain-containing protein, partial [Azonexus sp.]|nr:rhodanese-like domain-containing protein [Azonexus sp.]
MSPADLSRRRKGIATLDELGEFDVIIDVRSPAEFADDHIPGAISCPVLD